MRTCLNRLLIRSRVWGGMIPAHAAVARSSRSAACVENLSRTSYRVSCTKTALRDLLLDGFVPLRPQSRRSVVTKARYAGMSPWGTARTCPLASDARGLLGVDVALGTAGGDYVADLNLQPGFLVAGRGPGVAYNRHALLLPEHSND